MRAPNLILRPGLNGTGVMFRPLLAQLPPEVRAKVVAYPTSELLTYADLLPRVLAELPAGPFVLLGESFSGPLSLMAAATCPPGLRGVILCASFVRNPLKLRAKWLTHLAKPGVF